MPEKPSQNEDEYFARQDAELVQKQREEQERAAVEAERKTHYQRCPRCGGHLGTHDLEGVQIDQCPDCGGIWLDAGELEALRPKDPGMITRFFGNLFDYKTKKK